MSTLRSHYWEDNVYPESDGKPMADSTLQYRWIVTIKENLDALLADAFVAADLLWYPVQGDIYISQAPDVMVAFGRPKGERRSYKQWVEDGVAPQVVFEILSHSNSAADMQEKLAFYERYQVQEYYIYDPDKDKFSGYLRKDGTLERISIDNSIGWQSPLLKVSFKPKDIGSLAIYYPDGRPFLTVAQLMAMALSAEQRAEDAEQRAQSAKQQAEDAKQLSQRLADKLRALGINPDAL